MPVPESLDRLEVPVLLEIADVLVASTRSSLMAAIARASAVFGFT